MLVGCAATPVQPPPPITASGPSTTALSGRLAVLVVNDAGRSFNADFELKGTAQTGQLLLSGMLGTRLAEAQWNPSTVRVNTGSEQHTFRDLDQMALEVLGEPIPLAALFDWLQGRPWPQAPSHPLPLGAQGFSQIGWTVDLQRFDQGRVIAQRAAIQSASAAAAQPELMIRVRLDRP